MYDIVGDLRDARLLQYIAPGVAAVLLFFGLMRPKWVISHRRLPNWLKTPFVGCSTLRHRVISQVEHTNTTENADVRITYSDVHARLNDSPSKATRVFS